MLLIANCSLFIDLRAVFLFVVGRVRDAEECTRKGGYCQGMPKSISLSQVTLAIFSRMRFLSYIQFFTTTQ